MKHVVLHPRVVELFQTCEAAIDEGSFTVQGIVQRLLLLAAGYAVTSPSQSNEKPDHDPNTTICKSCFMATAAAAYNQARAPIVECGKCGQQNRIVRGMRDVLNAVCGTCRKPLIALADEDEKKEDSRDN